MAEGMNEELAYKALDHIREHPDGWSQYAFWSGGRACYAAHVVMIGMGMTCEQEFRDWQKANYRPCGTDGIAAELLGWNDEEAGSVFYNMTDDFSELERSVKDVLNGTFRA